MKLPRIILSAALIVGVVVTTAFPVSAEESTFGGGSVQSYASATPIDNGTIVQLDSKDANVVKRATKSEAQNMFGVTVDQSQLPLTITSEEANNEVFVAVSGTYNVLVSTQEGEIKAGDYITMSSINGIGMNAGADKTTVLGRANGGFDGKGVVLGTMTINDTAGQPTKEVKIGSVPVTINIQSNPNDITTKVQVPDFLERIGQAIAEKEVSPIRIYLSLAITAVSIIAAIVLIYSGVRNSIISIGRNPMSKKSVFRALLEIILTSLLILIVGLFAVYLLLRL